MRGRYIPPSMRKPGTAGGNRRGTRSPVGDTAVGKCVSGQVRDLWPRADEVLSRSVIWPNRGHRVAGNLDSVSSRPKLAAALTYLPTYLPTVVVASACFLAESSNGNPVLARSILQLVSTPWEAGLNSVAGSAFVLRRMRTPVTGNFQL